MDNGDSEDARLWRLFVSTGAIIMTESREVDRLINVARVDPNLLHTVTGQNFLQILCSREHLVPQERIVSMFDIFLRSPNFNVNHVDNFGFALIHYCVQMEDPIFLQMLLEMRRRDIDIDVQIDTSSWRDGDGLLQRRFTTITGCTALNLLFIQTIPRQEKLQLLLDNGASPNIVDHDGFGPIHNLIRNANYCMQTEITDNIRLLLAPRPPMPNHSNNNNADPNLRVQGGDFVGFTPLHIALASRCREYVFDALLEGGADVTLRDNVGRTPLEYARTFTEPTIHPAILELLWKKGPEFRAMRLHAERVLWRRTHGNRDIYQRILEEGGMHPPRHPQ